MVFTVMKWHFSFSYNKHPFTIQVLREFIKKEMICKDKEMINNFILTWRNAKRDTIFHLSDCQVKKFSNSTAGASVKKTGIYFHAGV